MCSPRPAELELCHGEGQGNGTRDVHVAQSHAQMAFCCNLDAFLSLEAFFSPVLVHLRREELNVPLE